MRPKVAEQSAPKEERDFDTRSYKKPEKIPGFLHGAFLRPLLASPRRLGANLFPPAFTDAFRYFVAKAQPVLSAGRIEESF